MLRTLTTVTSLLAFVGVYLLADMAASYEHIGHGLHPVLAMVGTAVLAVLVLLMHSVPVRR